MADVWDFLFLSGEFAPRTYILEGLTLQDVGTRPPGAPHSIYEELWHTVVWQRVVLERDTAALQGWDENEGFPALPPPHVRAPRRAVSVPGRVVRGLVGALAGGDGGLSVEAVCPVLNGSTGEDGPIQGPLELSGIPYVGCDIQSSVICMDKSLAYTVVAAAGIPTPDIPSVISR